MNSFVDNFRELELTFATVSETWLCDGNNLELEVENLLLGQGLSLFTKNRPLGNATFAHGGVAIVARDVNTKLRVHNFTNPEDFEVLAVGGTMHQIRRKVYIVACYIPPNYRVPKAKACMRHIADLVLDIKNTCRDALVCVSGDFNQWDVENYLADFPDLVEVQTGPTRNGRRIDRIFLNWPECVQSHSVLKPLEADLPGDDGVIPTSDHSVQFVRASLPRKEPVKWEKFTHRPFKEASATAFLKAINEQDWSTVLYANSSNDKATCFQLIIDDLMDHFFPIKTTRRKSDDLPWINEVARKKIRRKRAIFRDEARSKKWRAARHDLEKYLKKRRDVFLQNQREKVIGGEASKAFFKNVKSFNSVEKPKAFDIRDLEPDKTDEQVASSAADYFNRISREFSPLQPSDIPSTYFRQLPALSEEIVMKRLLECKRPNSRVVGDIFPKLVPKCAASLSIPLASIYNEILRSYVWPIAWKVEYVTPIPKKKLPGSFADLRNISCTKFVSKVFESFVLQFAMEEVNLKSNQYGGVKGCSTAHMLIELTQEICDNAEDYRSSTVLSALDYSKAFNRLSYQHCLKAFKKKGASTPIIRLIATFLTNRTMTVRVGNAWSEKKDVTGGCPQGSILGVFLFNMTTDDLEDDFLAFEHDRLDLPPFDNSAPQDRGEAEADQRLHGEGPDENAGHEQAVLTSTPEKFATFPELEISPLGGGVYRHRDISLTFLHGARNRPPELLLPMPERKVGTQVLTRKPIKIFKYVDDSISCERLNFGDVEITTVNGKPIKTKLALGIQNAFLSVTANAKIKGMQINEDKTGLICISDALHYEPSTYFKTEGDLVVHSTENIKVLGYHLSSRPGVHEQVRHIVKTIRQRYWMLRHLAGVGFNKPELVQVYKSSILPIADYCDVVYHPQLTDEQDQLLEGAQAGALRAIFGPKISARKLRSMAGVCTLRERRVEHCDKFARKCLLNERFACWFPLKSGRQSERHNQEKYREDFARCDRLKNSPIFYMRRRLNNKEGKKYGERNREYRED